MERKNIQPSIDNYYVYVYLDPSKPGNYGYGEYCMETIFEKF